MIVFKKIKILYILLIYFIIGQDICFAMDVSDISIDAIPIEYIFSNITGLFVYLSVPLAILAIIIGGIYYILAGYKKENSDKGKKMIEKAIIGLIIVLASYGIITLIIDILETVFN